jgi:hypothetical protein
LMLSKVLKYDLLDKQIPIDNGFLIESLLSTGLFS